MEVCGKAHVWMRGKYDDPVTYKKSKALKPISRSTVIRIIVPGVLFVLVIID